MEEIDLPSHLKTAILPNFVVFSKEIIDANDASTFDSREYQMPFYTHISA